jgi:predicted transcriptional regulator
MSPRESVVASARRADAAGRAEWLTALDASIRRGLADAEAGRTKPAEDVFDRLEGKYRRQVGPEK